MDVKINHEYLKLENQTEIQKTFTKNTPPIAILSNFFDKETYTKLKTKIERQRFEKVTDVLHRKYTRSNVPKILNKFFEENKEFRTLITVILKERIKHIDAITYKFTWKNYTIINDDTIEEPGFDMCINFTDNWDEEAGGSLVYVDGSGDFTKIPNKGNTLIIVKRDENTHKFIKYVNHKAQEKDRFFVLGNIHV